MNGSCVHIPAVRILTSVHKYGWKLLRIDGWIFIKLVVEEL
jgi:hypothetical protein